MIRIWRLESSVTQLAGPFVNYYRLETLQWIMYYRTKEKRKAKLNTSNNNAID